MQQVYGRADHRRPERALGRVEHGGVLPEARHQWCDVLQLALEVSRALDLPGFCRGGSAYFSGLSLDGDGALEAER